MHSAHDIYLINQFPDFTAPGFDTERYNSIFLDHNVIINAESSDVEYGEHWGPLSVKCAFRGREFYRSGNKTVAVDDLSYLIFNEGKVYSSYIKSPSRVESLTINFSPAFVGDVVQGMKQNDPDGSGTPAAGPRFMEKLYPHNPDVTPLLLTLQRMSKKIQSNKFRIAELFTELLERLIEGQDDVRTEIMKMSPLRSSTKEEIFKRLHQAKDYMDSCFAEDLSLTDVASVAALAPTYFLRSFKKNFHITPHQYITERRIQEAKVLLAFGKNSVSDVCLAVGYSDISSFSKLFKSRTGYSPLQYHSLIAS